MTAGPAEPSAPPSAATATAPEAPAAAPAETAALLLSIWRMGEFDPPTTAPSGATRLWQTFSRGMLDLFYPPQCAVTDQDLARQPNPWLAESVVTGLPLLREPLCPRCSAPMESPTATLPAGRCRACATCDGQFTQAVCLWEYEDLGRDLILTYKFGGQRQLARLLGRWLYAVAAARGLWAGVRWLTAAPGSQVIGSVTTRENHALQLAHAVVAADRAALQPVGLRLLPRGLRKIRATRPQATLPLSERLRGPQNSMVIDDPPVAGETVVMLDDVLTTLATATEAARALHAAGAREVRLLALARTL